jgi:hypothetical protein
MFISRYSRYRKAMIDSSRAIYYAVPPIQTPQEVRTAILKVIKERKVEAAEKGNGVKK